MCPTGHCFKPLICRHGQAGSCETHRLYCLWPPPATTREREREAKSGSNQTPGKVAPDKAPACLSMNRKMEFMSKREDIPQVRIWDLVQKVGGWVNPSPKLLKNSKRDTKGKNFLKKVKQSPLFSFQIFLFQNWKFPILIWSSSLQEESKLLITPSHLY